MLPSTNDVAATLAADPANDGVVVLARQQTAGRGRLGRLWHSPPGGVWMSVVLRPPPEVRRPVVLTAWAAVAVAAAVREAANLQARIKWPNDLLLGGHKVCGILIEQGAAAVVGIGLNVNATRSELDAAGLSGATSLCEAAGQTFDTDAVASALVRSLDREYGTLLAGEWTALESGWARRLGLLGRSVDVELISGERHRGRLTGLTLAGLQLDGDVTVTPEQVRHLTEGNRSASGATPSMLEYANDETSEK